MTDFDLVWAQYPRKTAKAVARKAWCKLSPDTALVQTMIDALGWQTQTSQWKRGVIPHFSTWLNQARWEDERPGSAHTVRQMASEDDIALGKAIREHHAQLALDRAAEYQAARPWMKVH